MTEQIATLEKARGLDALATRINEEHRACERAVVSAVEHAIRAGEMLLEAKEHAGHGNWGDWLRENFEGSVRTAQVYTRLANNKDALNAQRSAHLSIEGALRELSAPEPEDDGSRKETFEIIRAMVDGHMELRSDAERDALERVLEKPGTAEQNLLHALGVEELHILAAQVAVDGFLFERAAEEDHMLISYRAPLGEPAKAKERIVNVPIPATEAVENDETLAGCIERGCWQYALMEFRVWRLLSDWWARTLAADPEVDMELWQERALHSADWRQTDPAREFLLERVLRPETTRQQWVDEHALDPREFREMVGAVEVWVGLRARHLQKCLTGKGGKQA